MTNIDFTRAYIDRLCKEIGTRADAIYNAKTASWYFARGSSTIEVFLTQSDTDEENNRVFIRCLAPLCPLPANPVSQFDLLQKAMELNTHHMGFKLGLLKSKGLLCLISERDINGMDYLEFVTVLSDVGYWADHFDSYLHEHFGKL